MLAFIYVCLFSIVMWSVIAILTKGITREGVGSDAHKQVEAASNFEKWKWPSDMHLYTGGKAYMKDVGVIMLAAMQRIIGDKKTVYPVIMVSNFANSVSAVLIFLVAQYYWSTEVGVLLFIVYITCFWPYIIVLQGGYQTIAQMLVLLAIYFIQQAQLTCSFYQYGWYMASGVAFGLMQFSSASSCDNCIRPRDFSCWTCDNFN
jgi:hypothetical protein